MQADRKNVSWKAHDSVVMAVDWNVVNNLIVTGGEDCKYKVCVYVCIRVSQWQSRKYCVVVSRSRQ
jgi:hypothetical protein